MNNMTRKPSKNSKIRTRRERTKKLQFQCENQGCPNVTLRTPNKAKQAKHYFCSRKCRGQWQSEHPTTIRGPLHPLFGKPRPQYVIDKVSAALKGHEPWNKGKTGLQKHSSSTRQKMSLASIGKKKSESHRKNIARAKLGSKNPQYGKIPWNFGIPSSPETIEKIREARLFQEIPQDTKPEKLLHAELEKRGIELQKNIYIDGRPDIFILPNVCIFVDGDYHHANPSKYKPHDRIFGIKIVEEIWKHDKQVTDWLLEMGFKVMRFWQSEIEEDVALCVDMFLSGNFVTVIQEDGTRKHVYVNDTNSEKQG